MLDVIVCHYGGRVGGVDVETRLGATWSGNEGGS